MVSEEGERGLQGKALSGAKVREQDTGSPHKCIDGLAKKSEGSGVWQLLMKVREN